MPSRRRRRPRPRPRRGGSGRCTTISTRTSDAWPTTISSPTPSGSDLDVDVFDKELAEHVHADRVHEDFLSGVRSGVNGTPTFFINGLRHDDSYGSETLLSALQRAAEFGEVD